MTIFLTPFPYNLLMYNTDGKCQGKRILFRFRVGLFVCMLVLGFRLTPKFYTKYMETSQLAAKIALF